MTNSQKYKDHLRKHYERLYPEKPISERELELAQSHDARQKVYEAVFLDGLASDITAAAIGSIDQISFHQESSHVNPRTLRRGKLEFLETVKGINEALEKEKAICSRGRKEGEYEHKPLFAETYAGKLMRVFDILPPQRKADILRRAQEVISSSQKR